ncbi:hypothetical protein EI555_012036, partial [Monodon monoceros]
KPWTGSCGEEEERGRKPADAALCGETVAPFALSRFVEAKGARWPRVTLGMAAVKCELIKNFTSEETVHHDKISIIGTGLVVMACANSILLKGLSDELAFVDVDEGKLKGETVALQHGSPFMKMPNIVSSKDYLVTANSNLVIITAGAYPRKRETHFDVSWLQTDICFQSSGYLNYVAWKLSAFPKNHVTGTTWFLGSLLSTVKAVIDGSITIGKHGNLSVPDLNSDIGTDKDPEQWKNVHKEVITYGYEMVKRKVYINLAIGLTLADLTESIFKSLRRDLYGINEVFLSVPCILGENGIAHLTNIKLTSEEEARLKKIFRVEEILEQADYLYESGETEKLYQLLSQYKESEDAELLWRLARASRDIAQLSGTSEEEKKLLVYEALEYAKRALEKNESSFAAHKWYAICISDVGDYEGIRAKIANAYKIKEHFEALGYFHRAEQVDPNFYSKNLLLLGKTYLKLHNKKLAAFWLTKAKDYAAHTEEDKQIQTEAAQLLTGFSDKN